MLSAFLTRTLLCRILGPVRSWRYHRQMRRAFWQTTDQDRRMMAFYEPFVRAGDLVFDVGANVGNRTKIFSLLGARVVAVEPQPPCAEDLRIVCRGRDGIRIVGCALGRESGEADMLVSGSSTVSSLSACWIESVTKSQRLSGVLWDRTLRVPVRTLDSLIGEFGVPRFVKVDVEGYEAEVIQGLSRPLPALSLEFTPEFPAAIESCIERLSAMGEPEFQISLGESMEFWLTAWVGTGEILDRLRSVPPTAFGDLYVRFSAA